MRGYLALVGVVAFFCACGGMLILQKIMPENEDSSCIGCCGGAVFGVILCLVVTFWLFWLAGK
ncbi:MAG: hypothetical protein II922_04500 [Succinimonas sp.]|nr:hypothetical protein [Succinimonas sp.]